MAAIKTALLDALQDLPDDGLKEFKWRLSNSEDSGTVSIPRGMLENTNRHDVVDVMVQRYGASDAGTIAVRVLELIKQKELARQLKGKLQRVSSGSEEAGGGASSGAGAGASSGAGAGAGASSGAGAGAGASSGAQTSGLSVQIESTTGASVKAPVIQGGVFSGPVTFN